MGCDASAVTWRESRMEWLPHHGPQPAGEPSGPKVKHITFLVDPRHRQKWGMGTHRCQALLPVKVQAWFIILFEQVVTLSFFFPLRHLSGHNLGWMPDSSRSLSLKDAVYWEPVMSMHRYVKLLGPVQGWSLIWVRWKKLLVHVWMCVRTQSW